ncbi:hypothetical protein BJ875DRAFT_443992 [Amylocarpus encephaloides]|uniref:Uncharacterized protein n=1 Tax=Amylocarpus encephaloides TaxID=45428 RepID=A0A9P7YCU0_9HELO|nr:hypothetical protein BJ875DRAFT_443992 [Amylocarpus encephaloides]
MPPQSTRDIRRHWTELEDALLMDIWPRTRKHQGKGCRSAALSWPQVAEEMNARNQAHGLGFPRNFTNVALCNYTLKHEARLIDKWGTDGNAASMELAEYRATLPTPPSAPVPSSPSIFTLAPESALTSSSRSASVNYIGETTAASSVTSSPSALPTNTRSGGIILANGRTLLPSSHMRSGKTRAKTPFPDQPAHVKCMTPLEILADICSQAEYLPLKGTQEYEDNKAAEAKSVADGTQEEKPLNPFRLYKSPYPKLQ